MKVREILKLLRFDGWMLDRQRGSHRHFKHDHKPGIVTVPGKPNEDLHPKTLASILKQSGLEEE
jgi:predicted RNA binding protein YcfA (HicA-like mRNA interferase family)